MHDKDKRLNWSKYTWEEFEDICYEYACEKYSSDFYKVSITDRRKDGGRDIIIEDLIKNKHTWGECKHHSSSIGLDVIGKNVVLAITNQLQKIIFFSVTDVTPNTKHEILCAARIHGFEVLFLDGIDLDCEIAGNPQLLSRYFKESFDLFHPNKDIVVANVCVDEFSNAYNDSFYKDSRYYKLKQGLDFYIHIFLKNYYSVDVDSLEINIEEQKDCHFYVKKASIDKLGSFCDAIITIHGIILDLQKVVSLPPIAVSYQVDQHPQKDSIVLGEVDGRGIWKVPMCGSHNLEYLVSIDSLREQAICGHMRIVYLRGISGSGKTRMLEEIASLMIQKNFMPIYIDSMKFKKNYFFRELIRQLLCIPHLNSKNTFEECDFKALLEKYHISFPDVAMIYKFIWEEKRISVTKLGDFIYQCMTRMPMTSKLYIQIDNIQNLDEDTQGYLLFLLDKLLKVKCCACFAFALNTSYTKKSTNNPLIQYLENQRLHEEDSIMATHTMGKLDRPSRCDIVKKSLHLSSAYEKEIDEIAEKSGALPLDILLFCKMLSSSGCFSGDGKQQEIIDSEKFSELLSQLPDAVSSIIQVRLDAIYKKYSNKGILKLFQLILFFANRMPIVILDDFKINITTIGELKEDLVIVENPDSTLSFFHDNYYRYFLKKGTVYSFNNKETTLLLKYTEEYAFELGPVMEVNQVKCLYLLGQKDKFHMLTEKLLCKLKKNGFYQEIVELTTFYLSKVRSAQYKNQRLLYTIEKANAQIEAVSFVQGIKTLSDLAATIKLKGYMYDNNLIGSFYHQYVNAYTHSGKYHMALKVLHDFKTVEGLNPEQKFLIEDRFCLCQYALGNVDKAEKHIRKALVIAKEIGDDFWISTAYSDRAFNYFINTIDISKIKCYFRKAIKLYNKENDKSEYRSIEIDIQSAIVALLENKYKKANSSISKALLQATDRSYTYLLIPAQNVKAFILLKQGKTDDAISILEEARLNSEVFGSTKYMITIWNSLGIAYYAQENHKKSHTCFSNGEKILRTYSNPEDCAVRFSPLIVNWILSSWRNNPDDVRNNKHYYQYYDSFRINSILKKDIEYNAGINAINLAEHFPLIHEGYAMMY